MAQSRISRRRCLASAASGRCCSRSWRRSGPMRASSATSRSCAGAARPGPFPTWPRAWATRGSRRAFARPPALQRAQEVEQVLLLELGEAVEPRNHLIRLGAGACMLADRVLQVVAAPVVQEEDALTDPPQRRGAEFPARGRSLRDVVGEADAHV